MREFSRLRWAPDADGEELIRHHRVRRDMRLNVRVCGGMLARDTLPHRRQLRLRRLQGGAGREQAEHRNRRPGSWGMRVVDNAQRRPHIVRDREREALAHHADDGDVFRPELHGPAQHSGVTSKPRSPDVVSDHRNRRCIRARVGVRQPSGILKEARCRFELDGSKHVSPAA